MTPISTCPASRGRSSTVEPAPSLHVERHVGQDVREIIEAAGARLRYIPPYSPDFNPIEMVFAKLKAFLRKIAARSIPDLWDAVPLAIDRFAPEECKNFFAHAGYDA